jgi:HEAT repeat protein
MATYRAWAAVAAGLGLVGLWLAGCSDAESNLQSPKAEKRIQALRALGKQQSDEAVQKIAEVVNDQDHAVACEAVRVLAQTRRPAAKEVLKRVATADKRDAVRREAVAQYGAYAESLDTLREVAKADPDATVRAEAVRSMYRQRSLADVPLLVEIAETEQDLLVQARAVDAVEHLIGGVRFGYDPKSSPAERRKALERMRSQAIRIAASVIEYEKQKNQ